MSPYLTPWHSWRNSKSVGFLAVVALAIGIGAATAIYTVIDNLLLKPIPYEHGDRFVSVLGASFDDPNGLSSLTVKDALEYQDRSRSFDVFGCFIFADYNLTAPGEPQHLNGIEVEPTLVNGLGVRPALGGWFRDASIPAAMLSHSLWVRLGSDPNIVGKAVTLNGRIYTITGVMPPGFNLPLAGPYGEAQMDIWVPLDAVRQANASNLANTFCYARLRPGVTLAEASAEVKREAAEIARRDPASHPGYTARVDNLHELITKDLRPILLLLFAAAGLLLLITCANVGGLLVARAVSRARETAVRVALGAGLRQLAAQYLVEGLFVAVLGAAGGLLLSFAVIRALIALGGAQSARIAATSIGWPVIGFALAIAVLAGVLASMAPLWQAGRMQPNDVLSEGVRASAGARSRRLSRSLVVAEIALAFVLLALSSALVGELFRLMRVSPGFDPDHLLTFQITFAPDTVPGRPSRVEYQERLVRAIEAVPGVSGAGIINQLPLEGCCMVTTIYPEGAAANPRAPDRVNFLPVNPGYFRAMRIPLREGRFLEDRDRSENPLPVVIDESAAKRYWPNRNPVGLTGHIGNPGGTPFQVLGVTGDVKNNGLDNNTVPEVYLPAALVDVNPLNFVVRSPLPAKTLVPEVVRAVQAVNPGQPIHDVRTMNDIIRGSIVLKRAASYVMTFFGLAALIMATIGAYGVVSYSVRQRRVEIGTRMALGAVPRDLLGLVVGSGMKMAAWGIGIGGVASVAAIWFLVRNFQIEAGNGGAGRIQNPGILPFLISAALVGMVAAASSLFPAWWASLLSPMVAIRDEPGTLRSRTWPAVRTVSRTRAERIQDGTLVTELIEASRRAASYGEALVAALDALRGSVGARSAMLLEAAAGAGFETTVAVPDPAVRCSVPAHGLLVGRLKSYSSPLPITAEDLETWRRWASEVQPQHLPEIEMLARAGTRLAVALRTKSEVVGVLLFGERAGGGEFGGDEIRTVRGTADQFALLLENARLTARVLEQEKLRRDLALAAEVQRRLLARQSLENGFVSAAAMSIPARSVGGDYFDLLELKDGRTAIALADVAGKGVPAALIMSAVQALVRVLSADEQATLPDLVAKMNHFLYNSTGPSSYATFFYAQIDAQERKLRYVNAGHNPPYLVRTGSADIVELSTGGMVVGMFPKARYQEGVVDLEPGDVLLLFTDGVPEAQNPREEEFGEERVRSLLQEVACLPVAETISRIAQELRGWIQDGAQYDDLTFVLMKVRSEASG